MKRFTEWLFEKWKWQDDKIIREAYRTTFSTFHGRVVLDHLITNVYATIYEGTDPIAGAQHHGRRSVVHEILENIDRGEHPEKYEAKIELGEEVLHQYG